jgi:hypothetical protein
MSALSCSAIRSSDAKLLVAWSSPRRTKPRATGRRSKQRNNDAVVIPHGAFAGYATVPAGVRNALKIVAYHARDFRQGPLA